MVEICNYCKTCHDSTDCGHGTTVVETAPSQSEKEETPDYDLNRLTNSMSVEFN